MNVSRTIRNAAAFVLGGLLLVAAVCGCARQAVTEQAPAPDTSSSLAVQPAGEPPVAENRTPPAPTPVTPVYPLTGLPAEAEMKQRPIMVMVENAPQARPQTGLDQADLVYEILAEGEITRFAAVFQSESPQAIGPVRSIRPYYVELGDGLDALIVHAGWSQDAMNMLAGRKLAHFDEVYGDGRYYWRDSKRKMPHNLYTSVELIREGAADKSFRTLWNGPIVTFAKPESVEAAAVSNGLQPAVRAVIPYLHGYTVSYDYNAASGIYLRSMNGERHLDAASGRPLGGANVIVCFAEHKVVDNDGRRAVDVFGPGRGVLLQQGMKREVTWERKNGLLRVYADGRELGWLPGQTWVQIVPIGTELQFE